MAMKQISRSEFFTAFFDRDAVTSSVDRAKIRNFTRIGGNVRTIARRSIRPAGKAGKVSKPGDPPRSHTKLLRDNIYFAYDRMNDSVVIGPAALSGPTRYEPSDNTVPGVLEFGGTITVYEFWSFGLQRWLLSRYRFGPPGSRMRQRTVPIAARPYMGPALERSRDAYASLWEDCLTAR